MKTRRLTVLAPAILAAAAFAAAMGANAQAPPPSGTPPAAKDPQAAPMTGHHKHGVQGAKQAPDMKAECQAMMAKKDEMQNKMQAMDASLDKLVAEMNAAKGSKEVDALEKPMAAVLNELVAQRKAARSMTCLSRTRYLTKLGLRGVSPWLTRSGGGAGNSLSPRERNSTTS